MKSFLSLLYRITINIIGLELAATIFKHVEVTDFKVLLLAALILTIINIFIKPLVLIISLPVVFLTLGVAYLFVNAIIILLVSWVVSGYQVDGLWAAFGVGLVVSFVNVIFDFFAQSRVDRF